MVRRLATLASYERTKGWKCVTDVKIKSPERNQLWSVFDVFVGEKEAGANGEEEPGM